MVGEDARGGHELRIQGIAPPILKRRETDLISQMWSAINHLSTYMSDLLTGVQ